MDSKRTSVASHANSTLSQAASTRHMLAPPSTGTSPSSLANLGSRNNSTSDVSLTINYLPSKFSSGLLSPGGPRKRRGKGGFDGSGVPKRGGGVDAFRSGEARIPGMHDEDDDDDPQFGKKEKRLRWTKFKWILIFSNTLLSLYSLVALIFTLLTWFNTWGNADIVRVGNRPELIISTIAAVIGVLTSLLGWAGILLNNRSFLSWYCLLTWITFICLIIPGYITYKKETFNLEGKVNAQWSRDLGSSGRLRIQNELGCCGYFSPFVEATVSATCYSRSILEGCKRDYIDFQASICHRWWLVAFSIVPAQLFVMVAALLCSNHVTYRFGKGMMPKAYRLSMNSMAVIMDNYANQLAEQYGPDVASDIVNRSRSNLNLSSDSKSNGLGSGNLSMPMAMTSIGGGQPGGYAHTKYDSVGAGQI